jgi:hypothetical protein
MPCNWYCFLYVLAILVMVALSLFSVLVDDFIWVIVLGGLQAAAIAFYALISCCCGCGRIFHKFFGGFQVLHFLCSLACMIFCAVYGFRDTYMYLLLGLSLGFMLLDFILAVLAFVCLERIWKEDSSSSSSVSRISNEDSSSLCSSCAHSFGCWCILSVLGILMMTAVSLIAAVFCFADAGVSSILVGVLGVVQLIAMIVYVTARTWYAFKSIHVVLAIFELIHVVCSFICMIVSIVVGRDSFWPLACSLGFILFDLIIFASACCYLQ